MNAFTPSTLALLVALTISILVAWNFSRQEEEEDEGEGFICSAKATVHWHNADQTVSKFEVAIENDEELQLVCMALEMVPAFWSHEAAELAVQDAMRAYREGQK